MCRVINSKPTKRKSYAMRLREIKANASRHAEIKSNNAVRDIWQSAMKRPINTFGGEQAFLESIRQDVAIKKRVDQILANAKRKR